ncbi:MAG: secondary thiamine-phosphate synthase enzyme YjbQ [Chitinispirillaceae bacterium]|nr:secondary thiamine-phosphate synthase enzyme YjbQ [Chitinispirillaceae bacterium]
MIYGKEITVQTNGFSDIHDITEEVKKVIADSSISNGMVVIFSKGSTASISTIEYEAALTEDFRDQLDHLVPHTLHTRHSETWGDDNGFSHIRATLMGPGITVPVVDGEPVLGTWQQIVVIDHDNRPRLRKVYIQVIGE